MAYKVPTFDEMTSFLIALGKALLPTRNIGSRFTLYQKLFRVFAGGVTDVHANLRSAARDVMPATSSGTKLDEWLSTVGLTRKTATGSRKSAALRVTGTAGAVAPVGSLLVHVASGLTFQLTETATIPAVAPLRYDANVAAVDVGSATRLRAGEVLKFTGSIAGIKPAAELQKDLDEDGYDAEQDGAAKVRLLARLGDDAAGGTQADYVAWARAQTGIAAAYAYKGRIGIGSGDVAALHAGTGSARSLLPAERTALLAALAELAPAQMGSGALRVLATVEQIVNVEIAITVDGTAAYAWDWEDFGGQAISAYNATTREIAFASGLVPATIIPGDRISFRGVASVQDGRQYVVEAITGVATVSLQSAPVVAPAATDVAYSGGPIVARIRDAAIAHINGDVLYAGDLGPLPGAVAGLDTASLRVLVAGAGTANPSGMYGGWIGGVYRGILSTIATYTRGVRTHAVIAPAADVEATDYAAPLDGQIGMVSPGYVLIRRA